MSVTTIAAGSTAALALLYWKVLPFAYHLRLANAAIPPRIRRKVYNPDCDGAKLFEYIVETQSTPLSDLDINIHKSNSTYFVDLDIARVGLIYKLFSGGLTKLRSEKLPETGGKQCWVIILLAGVQTNFRQEIKPLEVFETYSRVLYWDDRWLYFCTYFVRRGTKEVIATSISKGILKADKVTLRPERLIEASGFMRPAGEAESSLLSGWDRRRIEEERLKGKKYGDAQSIVDSLAKDFVRAKL